MDTNTTNINIPKKEIAPGVFTTGGTATMPSINPISNQPNVIPTDALKPQASINLTLPPELQTQPGNIAGDMTYFQNLQNQQTAEQKRLQDLKDSANTDISNIMSSLGLKGAEQLNLEQQNVNPIQTQIADIAGQANTKIAEYNAQKAIYEKQKADIEATAGRKGLTTGAVMGQQGAVQRAAESALNTRASEIALLQAQAQALQGKADLAQQQVNRAIDLKYSGLENELKVKQFQLGLIQDSLSGAEKKQADALNYALNKEKDRIAEQKAKDLATEKMIVDATPNAPADVISKAKAIKEKGGSALEVAQALGKYGGDYLKTELLKQQIETEKAQRDKIYAETNALNQPGGGKPPTDTQIQNAGYADRIKQANNIIDANSKTFEGMNYIKFKAAASTSQLAGKLLTPEEKQVAQAMRNFITAKLRKESGAAISQSEFDDARIQYFPALGDDPQTLKQKKALRESVLNNLIAGSGSAYKLDPVETYFNYVTGHVEAVDNQVNNKEKSFLMSLTPTK